MSGGTRAPRSACAVALAAALATALATALAMAAVASARDRPSQPLPAGPFFARVSVVHDGDTLVATAAGGEVTVRIAGIDAPERAQPGGPESRAHLAALVCERSVRISAYKVDPFGRLVAYVRADGADVGLEQVDAGHAWHFTRYAHEQDPAQRAAYQQAQARARARGAGLWSGGEPEAPWAYRERQRRARAANEGAGSGAQGAVRERAAC